jgi:hypothetical protein
MDYATYANVRVRLGCALQKRAEQQLASACVGYPDAEWLQKL